VERAYVMGDAPDVLRTAFAQRSRWCKVENTPALASRATRLAAIVSWHAFPRSLTSTSFDVIVSMVLPHRVHGCLRLSLMWTG
jgi:cellulose synthase/poly-beta-1,6-N-acetylglucosamine synthase-like glycosyltransferase